MPIGMVRLRESAATKDDVKKQPLLENKACALSLSDTALNLPLADDPRMEVSTGCHLPEPEQVWKHGSYQSIDD